MSFSTELLPSLCCIPGFCFPRCKMVYLSSLKVLVSPFFLSIHVFLQGGSPKVSSSIWFGVVITSHQGTLDSIIQITYEDTKQLYAFVTGCQFEKELFITLLWVLPESQFPPTPQTLCPDHHTLSSLGVGK